MPNNGLSSADPAITPSPGNWEAALVRVEGKIDRLIDGLARQAEDTKTIRERLHEHANHLSALTALNIPDKLSTLREGHEQHELRIRPIEAEIGKVKESQARLDKHDIAITEIQTDMAQRRGAMVVMRALWAVVGFVGGGGIVAIIKLIAG